jgi:flagella basal body P-ring formation protein FlgA
MRLIFLLCILLFLSQAQAIERTVRGYTPLMLSELIPTLDGQDRRIQSEPIKQWVHLDEYLTPEELTRYSVPQNTTVWVDKCDQADKRTLADNVRAWLLAQPWSKGLEVSQVSLADKRVCREWLDVERFALLNSQYINSALVLINQSEPSQVLALDLTAKYSTWRASVPLKAGSQLHQSQLTQRWEPLVNSVNLVDLTLDFELDWKARRPIRTGQKISRGMLLQASTVEVGDEVMIVIFNGSLTIDTTGRALERGYLGEQVFILVDGAKAPVKGVVVQKGVVKIGT